ncbi:hypothetical protein D3C77_449070 [compost metagenome]
MNQFFEKLIRPPSECKLLRDMVYIVQRILQNDQFLVEVILQSRFHLVTENRIDRIKGYKAKTYERNQAADQKYGNDPVLKCNLLEPLHHQFSAHLSLGLP